MKKQNKEQNPNWKGGKGEFECLQCGKKFSSYQSERDRGGAKFCSIECGYENKRRRARTTCLECGKEFEAMVYAIERGKAFLCSKTCSGKWLSKHYSGENNRAYGKKQSAEHVEKRTRGKRGEGHCGWKGGIKYQGGYKFVIIGEDERYGLRGDSRNKTRRYYPEHRLIAEKALERKMGKNECVHHIDGDKLNNRNDNLLICSRGYHQVLHKRMSFLYQKEHFASSIS